MFGFDRKGKYGSGYATKEAILPNLFSEYFYTDQLFLRTSMPVSKSVHKFT